MSSTESLLTFVNSLPSTIPPLSACPNSQEKPSFRSNISIIETTLLMSTQKIPNFWNFAAHPSEYRKPTNLLTYSGTTWRLAMPRDPKIYSTPTVFCLCCWSSPLQPWWAFSSGRLLRAKYMLEHHLLLNLSAMVFLAAWLFWPTSSTIFFPPRLKF